MTTRTPFRPAGPLNGDEHASIETEELPSEAPAAAEPWPLNDLGDHNPLGFHVDEVLRAISDTLDGHEIGWRVSSLD